MLLFPLVAGVEKKLRFNYVEKYIFSSCFCRVLMNLEYIYLPSGVVTKQTFNIEVICTSRTAAASDLILNRC